MVTWLVVTGLGSFLIGAHVGGWLFYRAGWDHATMVAVIRTPLCDEHAAGKDHGDIP
jgi:hypothetical protein